ncbi:MAG: hypothetical protein ABW168_03380 [Sedimenticola sp.]
MRARLIVPGFLVVITLISGCADTTQIRNQVDYDEKRITKLKEEQLKIINPRLIEYRDYVYLGKGESIPLSERKVLPLIFESKKGIIMPPSSLRDITSEITKEFGIVTRVASEKGKTAESGGSFDITENKMPIRYFGTLENLLDTVCSNFDLHWKFDNGIIIFYKYETRKYIIAEFQGKRSASRSMSNTVEDSTSSESSGGGNVQQFSRSLNIDPWSEIKSTITGILTENGSITTSESAGMIIVTDLPEILDEIGDIVEKYNQVQLGQVAVELNIFTLSLTDSKDNSFDMNMLFTSLAREFAFGINGAAPISNQSGLGELSAAILTPLSDTENSSAKKWAGTNAMLKVLDSYGRATLAASGSGISLNNREMPIQVTARDGYLAGISVVTTSEVGVTETIEAGFTTSGLSLTTIPHIISNDLIMLEYSIDLSFLRNFLTLSTGSGKTIQVPNTRSRRFMQSVAIRSGSMIVLGGVDRVDRAAEDARGISGKSETSSSRRELVIMTLRAKNITGSIL